MPQKMYAALTCGFCRQPRKRGQLREVQCWGKDFDICDTCMDRCLGAVMVALGLMSG